jgi:hypothetical protein
VKIYFISKDSETSPEKSIYLFSLVLISLSILIILLHILYGEYEKVKETPSHLGNEEQALNNSSEIKTGSILNKKPVEQKESKKNK